MCRLLPKFVLALAMLVSSAALADPKLDTLIDRLQNAKDFRLRVQAALELGKLKDKHARDPLLAAMEDNHDSVRAAAAAALRTLADKEAVEPLKQYRLDRSQTVRRQVAKTLKVLESARRSAKVVVQLGSMKNGTGVKSDTVVRLLQESSREKLSELPGIFVVDDGEQAKAATQRRKVPVVMVTGSIQRLNVSRDGSEIIYSAKVEYILHNMPQQSIAATLSGSATARATVGEAKDKKRAAALRQAVLDAAIASAIRRASEALLAAVN